MGEVVVFSVVLVDWYVVDEVAFEEGSERSWSESSDLLSYLSFVSRCWSL